MSEAPNITWRPSLRVFIKRAALAGVILSLLVGFPTVTSDILRADLFGLVVFMAAIPISALFYAIVFDEFSIWNGQRHEEWKLTRTNLEFRNLDESMDFLAIPLHEIKSVKLSFWRGVVVRLQSGKAFTMNYITAPRAVQRTILDRLPQERTS